MISESDFIHLPYTPDLTEGGITCACRLMPYMYNRVRDMLFDRLRYLVGSVAVELAFRRYLGEQGLPFEVKGVKPFNDPDHYDVSLGGHCCHIQSFLITHRRQIKEMYRDPTLLLKAPALIPADQFAAEGRSNHDIYLFAFLCGLTARSRGNVQKAISANQPVYLTYPMPINWANQKLWQNLGPLALKSENGQTLAVELVGQDANREFLTKTIDLPPRMRVQVESDFYSLAYIHVSALPEGRLGLHSSSRNETCLIHPHEWGNIWVYGMDILLTGYLTHEEFRRRASLVPAGSRVFQFSRTHSKNLAVPIADLRPIGQLFERVKEWEAGKKTSE